MSTKNLYDYTTYFKLTIGIDEYFIDEPDTWDKIDIENVRDKNFFGFNEQFVSDQVQLQFGGDKKTKQTAVAIYPAFPLIKNVYDTYGSDFQISFEFGYIIANVQTWLFKGILNLNTYHCDNNAGTITCSVEKMVFNDLFRTRTDLPINFSSPLTADFAAIDLPTATQLVLKSKAIIKQYIAEVISPETVTSDDIARFVSIQPDNSNETATELGQGEGLPLGISGIDPRNELRFFFQAQEDGEYTLSFVCAFILTAFRAEFSGIGDYTVVPRFMIQRAATAKADVTVTPGQISGGVIQSVVITNQGAGYSYANIAIAGDGAGAQATAAIVNGKIVSISMTSGGVGYTNATVTITGDGAGATATITDGHLNVATITARGAGYTTATVDITGDGNGATATATITSGEITAINITNAGTGYTFAFLTINGDPEMSTIEYTTFEAFRVSGHSDARVQNMNLSANLNFVRTLKAGDMLYLDFVGTMGFPGTTYKYVVSNYTSNLRIVGQTTAPPSTCTAYRLFDALKFMLSVTTGNMNPLISSLLGPGGRGYDYYITNGYQIRNFDKALKPVITNLSEAFTSLSAIFGAGYGFANQAGNDILLFENIDFFFKDRKITQIKEIYDYARDHAKELVYNQVDIGYENYPSVSTGNGQGSTLDEFNTYHKYSLPITTYKSTLTKKSKWQAAGYAIEAQRREQFKINPSQSLTDDNSIFIISAPGGTSEGDENFENVSGVLDAVSAYDLRITPARMMLNWAKYVAIGLAKKPGNSFIANTFVDYNNTLVSSLAASDPHREFEPDFPVAEGQGFTVAQYTANNRSALHLPIFDSFKARVKFDQIKDLVDKLSFNAGTDDDGGWIVYNDDIGKYWKGYVWSVKYNPKTEEADFQVGVIGIY